MNAPNVLTLSRVVLAVVIIGLLLAGGGTNYGIAAALFIVACLTDFYDGYLAKKKGLVTDFGKIMDPLADKVLILGVFGVLGYLGLVQWWMVIIIAVREVAVTISRFRAMVKGQILAAEGAGKVKTAVQMASIILILLFLVAGRQVQTSWGAVINAFMLVSVILTVYSGAIYFKNTWQNRLI